MPLHQKILTGILLLLTGMLLGVLLMIYRGSWLPPERVEVRYTDVTRSANPIEPPGVDDTTWSPSFIFRDIASEIVPAVVYIETDVSADQQEMPDDEYHDFENRFWERFLPRRMPQSIGSGVLVTGDGYILTNHHVIEGSNGRIRVMTNDKKQFNARIVGSDPSTDLAVIKIDDDNHQPLIIGNSDHVNVGDWVMAVGNPFRLKSTVTAGIVSALGRDVDIISDRMRIESFIQTDAAINRGNSGGALVNTRGELIGINTAIASESGSYQGYGFAVPINLAMKIGQDIIEFGDVQRAFLGVEILSLDHRRARRLGLDKVAGVEVRNLVPGGSADQGGLESEDIVLKVNGHAVNEANHLQERIAMMRPGDEVSMKVWRDNDELDLSFQLMGRENEAIREWVEAEPREREHMEFDTDTESGVRQETFDAGFTIAELPSRDDMSQIELVVLRVEDDSDADRGGLKEEDIITRIDGHRIRDIQAFTEIWNPLYESGESVAIEILRDGEPLSLSL